MTVTTPIRPWRNLWMPAIFAALWCGAAAARAGDGDGEGGDDEERDEKVAKIEGELGELFAQKKYAEAAERCRALIALVPDDSSAHYNLACALARTGKTTEALEALLASVDFGFDDADHMKSDEDLASLRAEKAFGEIAAKAAKNQKMTWDTLYDPGGDVPGVKSLDGAPDGGLRYRLLLSKDATAQIPQRLIVWLHPSGGSMNDVVAPLAAQWTKAGWALLIPTQKRWEFWSGADAEKLMDRTLPEVAKVPGISAAKPVLLGFSAGGQMALMLWEKGASRFGGLVLDAAYPVAARSGPAEPAAPMKLPPGDAVRTVPLFVLVGDQDPMHGTWKEVEDGWRKAGVPLTVNYVAGGRHQWLFGKQQLAALATWLDDVAHGKLPGASEAKPAAPAAPADPPK